MSKDPKSVLVFAQVDSGAGVFVPNSHNVSVETYNTQTSEVTGNAELQKMTVNSLFASIHGLASGDIVEVHRVREESLVLDSISLLPLIPPSHNNHNGDKEHKKEKDAPRSLMDGKFAEIFLDNIRVVSQNSLVVVPDGNGGYNPYYVLFSQPLLQGLLNLEWI